ncbi:uncharacterized protein LOC112051274 [Bicyclus anynana]|uniref:snRNA-activating protein complex subunit 3 n=1 Tax=Bicyclus anynana TaxID=110368 RepID=A0ABM3LTG6_BICAN|nr:uncharacterized protein LOC112051274 [Bicyclus anynana]
MSMPMDTSTSVQETAQMQETCNATNDKIKTGAETPAMETVHNEFAETQSQNTQDSKGRNSVCDPMSVCGPYSNCPCSLHSKANESENEDVDLPLRRASLIGLEEDCEDDPNVMVVKSETVEILSLSKEKVKAAVKSTVDEDNSNTSRLSQTAENVIVNYHRPTSYQVQVTSTIGEENGCTSTSIHSLSQNVVNDVVVVNDGAEDKGPKPNEVNDRSKLTVTYTVEEESNASSSAQSLSQPIEVDADNEYNLFAEDVGPKIYQVKGNIVTPPIITKNLTEAFKFLPIFGTPKNTADLDEFQTAKVREYVGCDLSDEDFSKLAKFCSPHHLKTGNELKMSSRNPTQEPLPDHIISTLEAADFDGNLRLVKKLKLRVDKDDRHLYAKRLKYRGMKLLPLPQNEDYKISLSPLEPGKDLVFRVRVYRPFYCSNRDRHNTRHSVFSNDIVLLGRQKLTALRDRLVCPNDLSMRVDVSQNPEDQPETTAKDLFPSGFLFINNVFYVDTREGCKDLSAPIRQWARQRKLGDFPHHDMVQVSLDQLLVKLGHPEVYVHQGNCEHLFTFSEVRLLNATDPLRQSVYPFHTAISQNQTIYCTTCTELGAKWIVTGCSRVPFDPAFFCESCFKLYLYKDGKKVCNFQAYCYRGNEINLLKPIS